MGVESDNAFHAPSDWDTYYYFIIERCCSLINTGIWDGIDLIRLRIWLTNFTTNDEKYFAARVLDNLIYRSAEQTNSMLLQLFQRTIPDLVSQHPIPGITIPNWLDQFNRNKSNEDVKIYFVPVCTEFDPQSKSAPAIARLLKQKLGINEYYIQNSWQISKIPERKAIFFIDDILGSGDQFADFIDNQGLQPMLSSTYCAYIPLAAHINGIKALQEKYNIPIGTVEVLDNTHSLFHLKSDCFKDNINTSENAKSFFNSYLIQKKIKFEHGGYGDLQLAYVFSHATPDNNIPILWYEKSNDFKPLFSR